MQEWEIVAYSAALSAIIVAAKQLIEKEEGTQILGCITGLGLFLCIDVEAFFLGEALMNTAGAIIGGAAPFATAGMIAIATLTTREMASGSEKGLCVDHVAPTGYQVTSDYFRVEERDS